MKRFLRILRKFFFWVFFVCLFLLTTVTVLLHVYQDDIKAFAIEEINNHLKTPLEVRGIELSIFHDFPRASLEFKDVLIHDAFENQQSEDTLIYAHRMYLTFNVWDIWNGDYTVKRIEAADAKLNLRVNRGGEVNYDILKESEDDAESKGNFSFKLDLVRFDRLAFSYSNHATSQYYKIDILKGLAQGEFGESDFELRSESDVFVRQIKSNSITLLSNKPARIELEMDANTGAGMYTFKRGDIRIGEMPFELTGWVDTAAIDLTIRGKEIQLADLVNSLAAGTMPDATRYQGTGILNFESVIAGPVSATDMPSVTAEFDLHDGTLTNPSNNLKVYDVQLEGSYQNEQAKRTEKLAFSTLRFKLLESFFNANAEVVNFSQPLVDGSVSGDLDLASFHRFFRIPDVDEIGGVVKLDLDLRVQFFDPEYRKEKFEVYHSNGDMELTNVIFSRSGDDLVYRDINGELLIRNNDASVRDLKFRTNQSDIQLNGALSNLVGYVTGNGGLGIVADLESKYIDLNEFIGETENETEGELEKFELPPDLNLNIDLDVGTMKWDQHEFTAITGKLLLANRKATAKNFHLKTVGGDIRGGLTLTNGLDAGNAIEGNFAFSGVDIKTLFAEWKNFDQETITDKHLSGTAKGTLDILLFFNPYFSIIEEKIFAVTDLQIDNGTLKDMETMKLITDYMRSNKALKMLLNKHIDKFEEKLLNIQFKTLRNTIEIKDRKIIIPEMLIASSALDVNLFGWHDFDNNVEYHFSFRFRDLKTVAEYTEFGKIEDDGLGLVIYLTMSGPIDNPEFSLDSDERKNDVRENLAEEKSTVKSMLKTEFGLFRNDSTVQKMNVSNKKQVEFIYYEEDNEAGDSSTVKKNRQRSWKWADKLKEKSDKDQEYEEDDFE